MVDWRKEYKSSDLFKRDRASKDEAEPAAVAESESPKPARSFLKQEIHLFGSRAKAPHEPKEDKPSSDEPWYKKDVSLKKSKAAEPAPPGDPSELAPPGDPSVPWYKKEVSLKRRPATEPGPESPPLPPVSEAPPRPVQLPATAPEPVELEPKPELVADVKPEAARVMHALPDPEPEPEPEPVVHIVPEPVSVTEAEPEPELEPVRAVSWVDAMLEPGTPVSEHAIESAPVAELPVFPPPALAAELPVFPAAAAELPVFPPPAAVAELPAFPLPAPVAEPDPRTLHPPVTAQELPPLGPDADSQPSMRWYKRELSFGRKPKEKEPYEPDAPHVPFWKKQLSLGRGARAPKAEPVAVEAGPAAAKPVPFWKKELPFGRGAKAPKAEPVAVEAGPTAAKPVPFWKKELPFGRRAVKNSAPEGTDEDRVKSEKPSPRPFWKRDFSFNLSLPQRGVRGGKSKGGSIPKQLVGLKIGASQLAAARVANNGHAEVLQLARQPLDQGVIVGGELRDPEALTQALKQFFHRNKLPKRGVRLGIANNRIGVRTFEISGIDDPKQLTNAIRFRAQEALPIPIDEAVLDYQVLEETVNEEGETVRKILLVVAYRELVDRYVAACRQAGITLVGIDLEAFALLRALAAPREEETGRVAVVAVAVGHDRSTFAVSDGRVCEFTRVLDWGGQNLNVAIARALDITPSEAEPIKRLLSLEGGPTPEGFGEEQFSAAREAALAQVNTFARELVSSLQFYQSQPGSLGIGEIIITGGTAHLEGFAPQLQRLIGVKVRIGDPLVRVTVPKRFQEPDQIGSLTVAIGLGIED